MSDPVRSRLPPFNPRPAKRLRQAALVALTLLPGIAHADQITVFAAASLKTALDAAATGWQAKTGHSAVIAYAGSSALAKQIQQGAPADIFISASTQWMDTLATDDLILPDSRRDILGNTLVLIAHGKDAAPVTIAPGFDLAGLIGDGKLSMALVDSVPAGQYGKTALQSLGLWASVEPQVAQSENVRAALSLVALGEAPLGIVYASDAIADDGADDQVSVVGTFPANSHKPITYPAAIIRGTTNPITSADFIAYLSSDAGDAIFAAQGFLILD